MARKAFTLPLLALLLVHPLSAISARGALTGVHDFRGPIPPTSSPALSILAIALLLAFLIFWVARRRKDRSQEPTPPLRSLLIQTVAALSEEYRQGQISETVVADRVSGIIRRNLSESTGSGSDHLTSEELIASLVGVIQAEDLSRVASILFFCDSIRYGAVTPASSRIEWALCETRCLLDCASEVGT